MLDDSFPTMGTVARVVRDADGGLDVPAVFAEPGAPKHSPESLAVELRRMADWLGLGAVSAPIGGDLAKPVTTALKQLGLS